ncbi:MAG: lipid-A-disaccharide synthase N-terminal domain-containing protein [Planctomycetes bacterium]|nr:lipid-A-disaccharide synthase N-terminal domain-containing protein [Planctomycetota bacterium]
MSGACLFAVGLLVSWPNSTTAGQESCTTPSAETVRSRQDSSVASEAGSSLSLATWVAANEPVPDCVLYGKDNPAPRVPSHGHTGWNDLVSNGEPCAYCGRSPQPEAVSYFFLCLGFLGQGLFGVRFILQWLASEKSKSVVIPEAFWWASIAGAVATGVYAVSIMALPIIMSQGLNCMIYGRNLYFFRSGAKVAQNHV